MKQLTSKDLNKARKYKDIYEFYTSRIRNTNGETKEIIDEICYRFYISPTQARHIIRTMLKKMY